MIKQSNHYLEKVVIVFIYFGTISREEIKNEEARRKRKGTN